jgi:hypothetical protein
MQWGALHSFWGKEEDIGDAFGRVISAENKYRIFGLLAASAALQSNKVLDRNGRERAAMPE